MDNIVERIAKLLALAESATTQEEAAAAYEKAQAMASKYSIDMAAARAASKGKNKGVLVMETVDVGQRRAHSNKFLLQLLIRVAHANDLRISLAHNNTYGVLHGYEEDVEATKMMWAAIAPKMQQMAEAYLATDEWRQETVYRAKRVKDEYWGGYDEQWGHHPITKQSARASYYEAFVSVVGQRLDEARAQAVKAATEAEEHFHQASPDADAGGVATQAVTGTALVLKEKSKEVEEFYYKKNPHFRRSRGGGWRGYERSGGYSRSAGAAGRSDGSRVSLGGGGSIGGQRPGIGG